MVNTFEYLYASLSFLSASVTDSGGEELRNRLKFRVSVTSSFSRITPYHQLPLAKERKTHIFTKDILSVVGLITIDVISSITKGT
jgi:hypothetical protein